MVFFLYILTAITSAIVLSLLLIPEFLEKAEIKAEDRAYRNLACWLVFFCTQDVIWGLAAGQWFKSNLFLYISSIVFHLSTVTTTCLWVHYVFTYMREFIKPKVRHVVQTMATLLVCFQVIALAINCFKPIFFYVNEHGEYCTGPIRTVSFYLQYVVYLAIGLVAITVYLLSRKGKKEIRNKFLAVLFFVAFPILCGFFQFCFPDGAFYSIGYMLGCCVIHVFIVSKERRALLEIQAEKLQQALSVMTEDLRNAKEKAENASRAKTEFLFNMSHDIRTPMNAIIGFTNILEKNLDNKEQREEYIHKIQTSSGIMLELINNVLEMARIESGKVTLDESFWDAQEFNDTLVSVFEGQLNKKNLHFTRTVNVQHSEVFCDSTKVKEIFLNLLGNAVKYTPEGGTISMDLTEIPSTKKGYAFYKTVIKDTGIGISKDFIPHIFESFTRESNTTSSKITGTGLGLAITKKLVDFMDGTITVESEQNKGSTFTVILPHRIADSNYMARECNKAHEVNTNNLQGKRILLAEDNFLNAEIAITILSEAGLKVDHASDGIECINMLQKAEDGYYDLILMDVQMPNCNGYEATKIIRSQENKKKNIPIVAMTANAFDEDKKNALNAGMNAHIAKPIDIQKLFAVLQQEIC